MPNAAFAILVVSLSALAAALLLQYGFDVKPCELCLWQRGPYAANAALAFLLFVVPPRNQKLLLGMCAFLFFANAALALFHSGVERHWWVFHSACTGADLAGASIEEMRQRLLATPVTRCDEISWSLFGLSMANFNAVFSVFLGLFVTFVARKKG